MVPRTQTTAPVAFGWIWGVAAATATAALVAEYGFGEPILSPAFIRILLIASTALFTLSRLVLLFPGSEAGGRLRRWWVDYVLLAAAAVWWGIDPDHEPVILRVSAVYVLGLGVGVAVAAVLRAFVERILSGRLAGMAWRIVAMLAVCGLAGGLVISLPACYAAPVTGQKWEQQAMHVLNCSFTAAAAVTCTGLTPLEVGEDFSPAGQITILVLLQIGGIAALIIGTALGVRLRELAGGNGARHARQLLRWSIGSMVAVEIVGAAALYSMWDPSHDPAFAGATTLPSVGWVESERVLFGVFHAVSAFCNGGLSLSRDRLAGYAWQWQLYGVILPLMILGSIGAPTLFELWNLRRRSDRPPLSGHAKWTLWGTLVLLVGGALGLWSIEGERRLQLRFPREDTPGRLRVEAAQTQGQIAAEAPRRADRLSAMPAGGRLAASLFVSAAARTGGLGGTRLDEASLAPASRWVLMLLMLAGGGIGGTAGGVRILTAVLCLRAVLRPGRDEGVSAAAWSVLGAMLLLVGAVSFVLLYRDVGSFEASLFETVSAACNVGLTTGLTRQLYVESKLALIAAMLIGRAIPLGLLARLGEGAWRESASATRS